MARPPTLHSPQLMSAKALPPDDDPVLQCLNGGRAKQPSLSRSPPAML